MTGRVAQPLSAWHTIQAGQVLISALRPVLMTPASCGWGQMDAWSGAQMQSLGTCDVSQDHNHTYALRMIEIIFIVFFEIWVWVNTYRYHLVGWTSVYQLFWCSPGVQGFDPSPFMQDMQVQASVKSLTRCEDCIAPNSVLAKNDSGNDSLLLHFCLTIKYLFTSKLPVFYVTC